MSRFARPTKRPMNQNGNRNREFGERGPARDTRSRPESVIGRPPGDPGKRHSAPRSADGCTPIPAIRSAQPTPPKRTFPYAFWLAGLGGSRTVRLLAFLGRSGRSETRRRSRYHRKTLCYGPLVMLRSGPHLRQSVQFILGSPLQGRWAHAVPPDDARSLPPLSRPRSH
jgi:hypothetical protein